MGRSGLVLGVHCIGEDYFLVLRPSVHEAFIVRYKSLLHRRIGLLRQPRRSNPLVAEPVHQLDRAQRRVTGPVGLP